MFSMECRYVLYCYMKDIGVCLDLDHMRITCTQSLITISYVVITYCNVTLILQVVRDYFKDYTRRLGCPEFNATNNTEYSPYCYDATWVLALALNKTVAGMCLLLIIMYTHTCDHGRAVCFIHACVCIDRGYTN